MADEMRERGAVRCQLAPGDGPDMARYAVHQEDGRVVTGSCPAGEFWPDQEMMGPGVGGLVACSRVGYHAGCVTVRLPDGLFASVRESALRDRPDGYDPGAVYEPTEAAPVKDGPASAVAADDRQALVRVLSHLAAEARGLKEKAHLLDATVRLVRRALHVRPVAAGEGRGDE